MSNGSKDPEVPPSPEHWWPRYSDEDTPERRPGLWTRLRDWFARPAPKRNSYVSNVVDPDDRRFTPRR
jgi:hypothetical protein